jgi:hypothetical protein
MELLLILLYVSICYVGVQGLSNTGQPMVARQRRWAASLALRCFC